MTERGDVGTRGAAAFLRRHRVLAVLLSVGFVLRVLATVGYRPALIYIDSAASYLAQLRSLDPRGPNPLGYGVLLLRPVLVVGNLLTVVIVQHLMGLLMAVLIYALLVRRGTRNWLAALATAPLLLDAYQVQIEQNIMSDVLLQALLLGAVTLVAWRSAPGWRTAAAAGVLLGLATLTRLAGVLAIVAVVGYLLWVGRGRRRFALAAVALTAFALPVYGYAQYYHHVSGHYALSPSGGAMAYGRAATFVDCRGMEMPGYERQLCPRQPLGHRHGPDWYAHDPASAVFALQTPPGVALDDALQDFARRSVLHQPFAFAGAVAADAAKVFHLTHDDLANPDAPAERWRFQLTYPMYPALVTADTVAQFGDRYGGGGPVVVRPVAEILRGYQLSVGYTPGPVVALAVLLALAAGVVRRRRPNPVRPVCLLFLGTGALVLLFADTFEFTWRYQLPALVLLPVAGVLGVTSMLHRSADDDASFPEPADHDATAAFAARYGEVRFPSVVVLIAAYNEAEALGPVLAAMPTSCLGEEINTLVVVDGGSDDTARVALRRDEYTCPVYTCVAPVNRGQGAALRLGYHLARAGGARYIVTTDADGQYDITELPALLEPLLDGSADFVTGSRRLGVDRSRDQVRRTGVRVFAWLVAVLTGQPVTDTSFGFRAMTAEVTGAVTLQQPQYQASELLIEVISRGYTVVERPMTMRPRAGGKTKKGNNLLYGFRYSRVVFSTWARQRLRPPVPSAAADGLGSGTPTGPAVGI